MSDDKNIDERNRKLAEVAIKRDRKLAALRSVNPNWPPRKCPACGEHSQRDRCIGCGADAWEFWALMLKTDLETVAEAVMTLLEQGAWTSPNKTGQCQRTYAATRIEEILTGIAERYPDEGEE